MLFKILGIVWVLLGLWWLIKPDSLRNRFHKKMTRRMKRVVFFFMIIFSFMLIGSIVKAPGMTTRIAGILGLIIAGKVIMMLVTKTSETFFAWLGARSLVFFRIWAVFILVLGAAAFFA